MGGHDERNGSMFSHVSPEVRIPAYHALRSIRRITDRALERLSPVFDRLYVRFGRLWVSNADSCADPRIGHVAEHAASDLR